MNSFHMFIPEASSIAARIDALFWSMIALCGLVALGVFVAIIFYCIRYRRGSQADRTGRHNQSLGVELTWTLIPFALFIAVFIWSLILFAQARTPPASAQTLYVVAKQWMWKVQHPAGQREINTLHVPLGEPVRLIMTSQDVIHSFYVPAFRVKQDVLPGRYTQLWFTATQLGTFPLFCAEYCGLDHSKMGGAVVVMSPADYALWLTGHDTGESLAARGAALFRSRGCSGCHGTNASVHAPDLEGLYGRPVQLTDGTTVIADQRYLHDSILLPNTQVVAGYASIMPSFSGQLSEEEFLALIAYIKSTSPKANAEGPMSAIDARATVHSFLDRDYGLRAWLTTRDHKRIAILYALGITFFFFLGGAAATLIRLNLATPDGALMGAATYNKTFTFHGVVMVWFFLIPSIPATLGNFLLPLMIGARDVAFPRLNLASWYLYMLGGLFTIAALLAGGVDTGWTFYTPFSTMFSNSNVFLVVIGVFITGFSSIFTGLNFIVTVHSLRTHAMTWFRLPLFVWAIYATSLVMVLATPVLAMTLALIGLERGFGVGVFDPALGGDPLLFQHLFWFYSHPAVYIMILPAMGLVSEIIACFVRRRVFGYQFMTYSMLGIAVIGFLVWGHHMFVSGQSMYASMVFSFLSFVVAVPSAIKVFNWTATLRKGDISFEAPMLYALGFVGLFMLGGLTGLILAAPALDVPLTDTYFVVAHFHYVMVGGSVMAYLGGIHYWWPKVTGKMYPEGWARFAAILMFFGFNLTFFPQYLLGYEGMPRRYFSYPPQFQVLNVLSSAGASILAIGYLLPAAYLLWSLRYGAAAGNNPWNARGLEWQTSSPPPKENFVRPPVVREAYAYDEPAP